MAKVKQIKTIVERRDHSEKFDREVNSALSAGWILIRRYLNSGRTTGINEPLTFYPVLVAEMEKEVDVNG